MRKTNHDHGAAFLREGRCHRHGSPKRAAGEANIADMSKHQASGRACVRRSKDPVVEILVRLTSALERLSPIDIDRGREELPYRWMQYDDGMWTPVYPDGTTGHQFTWTQMIAARGEDVGDFIAFFAAGLITDVQGSPAGPFENDRG